MSVSCLCCVYASCLSPFRMHVVCAPVYIVVSLLLFCLSRLSSTCLATRSLGSTHPVGLALGMTLGLRSGLRSGYTCSSSGRYISTLLPRLSPIILLCCSSVFSVAYHKPLPSCRFVLRLISTNSPMLSLLPTARLQNCMARWRSG